jgi:galactoside O-acetyltransferase
MIRFLKKIVKRSKSRNDTLNNYRYVDINETTFLKGGLKLIFYTKKDEKKYLEIGSRGIINSKFIFESEKGSVKIGDNVHIGNATFISRNSIVVGNDVTMAWDIVIYDHNSHSIYWEERKNDNNQCYQDYINHSGNNIVNKDWVNVKDAPIIIKDKVWLGFGVTVLKGVTIGEGAVVGAKSVVTKDVLPWTVVAGNPAKEIKSIIR